MDCSEIRLNVAREYYNRLKLEMDGACLGAYVFGSVARGKAKKSSDLDMIFVLKRPSREERYFWNTSEELAKREGSYNFAKNSHMMFRLQEELEKKHGFPIAIYTHYECKGLENIIPLHQGAFVKFGDIISGAICLDE